MHVIRRSLLSALMVGLVAAPAFAQLPVPTPRLRILVVHGPNMNLLGRREPAIYGTMTLDQVNAELQKVAKEVNAELIILQSNEMGAMVDAFQKHMDDVDGALINAAGYSQYGVALHDVIKAVPFPTMEVHMSNLGARDDIHKLSVITPAARGTIMGLGWRSYTMALRAIAEIVREDKASKAAGTHNHD